MLWQIPLVLDIENVPGEHIKNQCYYTDFVHCLIAYANVLMFNWVNKQNTSANLSVGEEVQGFIAWSLRLLLRKL